MYMVDVVVMEEDVEAIWDASLLWTITKMASSEIQGRQNGYVSHIMNKYNCICFLGGEPAEVYWESGAKHRGGYAFRLCKVHNQKYWKVTEECFQQGHLNFQVPILY